MDEEATLPIQYPLPASSPTFHELFLGNEATPVAGDPHSSKVRPRAVEEATRGAQISDGIKSGSVRALPGRPTARLTTTSMQLNMYGTKTPDFRGQNTISITGKCQHCQHQHTDYQRTFCLAGFERIHCQSCHQRILGIGTETANTTLMNGLNRRSSSMSGPNLSLACTNDPEFSSTFVAEPSTVDGLDRGDTVSEACVPAPNRQPDTPGVSAQNIGRRRSLVPNRTIMSRRAGSRRGSLQKRSSPQQSSEQPLVRQRRSRLPRVEVWAEGCCERILSRLRVV